MRIIAFSNGIILNLQHIMVIFAERTGTIHFATIIICIFKYLFLEVKINVRHCVYKVNSEAADEIARQIKLRNLSGIIIIDFINMKSEDNTQKLMSGLRHLFKNDKVTTTLIDITKLGLVEVTRKREGVTLLQALKDTSF